MKHKKSKNPPPNYFVKYINIARTPNMPLAKKNPGSLKSLILGTTDSINASNRVAKIKKKIFNTIAKKKF
jgi:hypothetical protein